MMRGFRPSLPSRGEFAYEQAEDAGVTVKATFKQMVERRLVGISQNEISPPAGHLPVAVRRSSKNLCAASPGHEDVGRFDIAMNDSALVRGVEGVGNVNGNLEQLFEGEG